MIYKNMKTKEEVYKFICEYEGEVGESFTDRFMHDNVKDTSWAFWLLGKGYSERANIIINLILKGETCLDQSLLYEVNYSVVVDDYGDGGIKAYKELGLAEADKLYSKDVELWSEFLTSTSFYNVRISEFIKDYNKGSNYEN